VIPGPDLRPNPDSARRLAGDDRLDHATMQEGLGMTIVWFVVWLVFNLIGDSEPLAFDPVNVWAGTLLAAVALDLNRSPGLPGRSG
jgi:Fe2+ transport system protein B